MPWVHPEILTLTYSVVDDDGAKSTMSFFAELPAINQWTHDAMWNTAVELWALINPLIDAAFLGVTMSLSSYFTPPQSAADGSDVEDKGVFLLTTDNNQKGSLSLASILESKLVDTGLGKGIQLDFADADVQAFADALVNGIDLNPFGILDTVKFGTSRGEPWELVRDGYKQNRKSQKSRGYRG